MGYPAKVPVRFFNGGEYVVINGKKYVLEKTCHIVWNEIDKTWECDACGGAVGLPEVAYCESCGARVIE